MLKYTVFTCITMAKPRKKNGGGSLDLMKKQMSRACVCFVALRPKSTAIVMAGRYPRHVISNNVAF